MNSTVGTRAHIVYFSHGGGPLPILGDPRHQAMVDFMVRLPNQFPKPEAVLVVSAHWEEEVGTLLGSEAPPMYYDYYGFPEKAYDIVYPAPGSPELADRIARMMKAHGIANRVDRRRGFDHGLFIPLKMMYPEADLPCLQLSLVSGLDPALHLALGAALRGLKEQNILIIGSGFSFHNMMGFFQGGDRAPDSQNDAFQDWLIETCTGPLAASERAIRLIDWEKAPSARYCHPREEHLLPLHVCMGIADEPGRTIFDDYIAGKRSVAFLW